MDDELGVSDGFTVDDGELDTHVAAVDRVAEQVRAAAGAGRPLDRTAYGVLGQVFAGAAAEAVGAGSAVVADLAGTTAEFGAGVRACREEYRQAERRAAEGFRPR